MRIALLELGSTTVNVAVFGRGPAETSAGRTPRWTVTRAIEPLVTGDRIDGVAFARGLAEVGTMLTELRMLERDCALVAVATGALADAVNAPTWADDLARRHGLVIELVPPALQTRLGYAACRHELGVDGPLAVLKLGAGWLGLACGGDQADVLQIAWLGPWADPAEQPLFSRVARERLAARIRFAVATPARSIWSHDPAHLVIDADVAVALGAIADELGLRAEGATTLDVAMLGRIIEVLSQFRPITLPGSIGLQTDHLAHGALVVQTTMQLLGFRSATVGPSVSQAALLAYALGAVHGADGIAVGA